MLQPDGTLKLIDFGIAREYKEASSGDTTYIGTKGYAAPGAVWQSPDRRPDGPILPEGDHAPPKGDVRDSFLRRLVVGDIPYVWVIREISTTQSAC